MKRICLMFLYLIPAIAYAQKINIPAVYKNKLKIRKLTIDDGLSQNIVHDILQDSQGFMWFATTGGLNRFDGQTFKVYTHAVGDSTNLHNSYVSKLLEDKQQNIWVGTVKGVEVFNTKNGKFYQPHYSKQSNTHLGYGWVNALARDKKGNVWVGSDKGLDKLMTSAKPVHSPTFRRYWHKTKDTTKQYFFIKSLLCDKSGTVWLGTSSGLKKLVQQANGEVGVIDQPLPFKKSKYIRCLYEDQQGRIWVGSEQGELCILDAYTRKTTLFASGLVRVNVLHQDSNGTIWVGTERGLKWIDEKTQSVASFFYPNTHLDNIVIPSIYEDKSGVLWVGTLGYGVFQLDSKSPKFGHYRLSDYTQKPLKNDMVWGIFQDKGGNRLWLCSSKNGLYHLDRNTGKLTHFTHDPTNPQSLTHSKPRRIVKTSDGTIWVTAIDGLNKYNEASQTFERFHLEPKPSMATSIYSIAKDKADNLWMTTRTGRVYKFNTQTKEFTRMQSKHFGGGWASSIVEDHQGILWISTYSSVVLYNPQTQQVTQAYKGGPINTIGLKKRRTLQIFKAQSGQLWITTYGDGVAKVIRDGGNKFHLQYYDQKDGLPTNMVYNILEDKKGNLWMSTENGVAKFDPIAEKFTNYTTKDGLPNDDFGEGAFFQDTTTGEMFFGGQNGVAAFIPDEVVPNNYMPNVVLTDFQLANKSVQPSANAPLKQTANYTKKITLTYEQATVFSFEFAALSYANADKNQYKVTLEGYDKTWRNLQNRRFVTYTGIAPGTYYFRVRASNHDGVWNNKGLSIELVILPAWWQTWWFKIGWVSLLIALSVGFYLYRVNTIKRQKRVLEATVKIRTKEVVEQKEEIQMQNEELVQKSEEITAQHQAIEAKNKLLTEKNYHIQQSIRAAQTIQEAILPFEHRMQQAFGNDYFVMYKPKDVVSGDFYWLGKVGRKTLLGVVDCTGHGVPGAFMSMIGFTLLNEIINTQQVDTPAAILEQLRRDIRYVLKQDETGSRNGMDAVFVSLEPRQNQSTKVTFAGAKRPLWYIIPRGTALEAIKGSSVSIGVIYRNPRTIENHIIQCPVGSLLYLSTDGFVDQNSATTKRFGTTNLQTFLYDVHRLPLAKQKEVLEAKMTEFMAGTEQRDDILLMGIKI